MSLSYPQNTSNTGPLDCEISLEEIKLGAYILRKGKAPGYDRISNEMLSCLLKTRPSVFKKLFNSILGNSKALIMWNINYVEYFHYITSFKKGSKTKPENYRGISLLSCLGKFFSAILNQRLIKYINEKRILAKAHLGFTAGNRTSDALLILFYAFLSRDDDNPRRVSADWTDVYDTHNIEHRNRTS